MARIKQVRTAPGLPFEVLEVSTESVPGMNVSLYEEVTRLAAEKYDEALRRLTTKLMKKSAAQFAGISFVSRKPFEARVLVVHISGRRVTFWIVFDLYGPVGETERLLLSLLDRLPSLAGLRVENGNFVGEVMLPQEPCQVTALQTRRVTYFISDEREPLPQPAVLKKAASR